MRAREFTINIPINVKISGDEIEAISPPPPTEAKTTQVTGLSAVELKPVEPVEPKILKPTLISKNKDHDDNDVDVAPNFNRNPDREEEKEKELGVFTPPLQQKIELLKKNTGVESEFDHEDVDDGSSK